MSTEPNDVSREVSSLSIQSDGTDGAKTLNAQELRARAKAERAAARVKSTPTTTEVEEDDPLKDKYGDAPLVQSQAISGRTWTDLVALQPSMEQQTVLLRGRVHTVRGKGKSAFLVLRQGTSTVQIVFFVNNETVSKGMVKYASNLTRESVIDVEGVVVLPQAPVEGCSVRLVEIAATSVKCISRAAGLPLEVIDAARSEAEAIAAAASGDAKLVTVNADTRLDRRYIDLRTPANQAIFRIQSGVCALFRDFLSRRSFVEIHTPKLIAGSSEGGASVFKLNYMGKSACLAQSPQLYKQMAICGDLDRVFEIGPVFRAENSNTHRHLCEFTGMDLEMSIREHYSEVMDVIGELFVSMFDGLNQKHAHELEVINKQYAFAPLQYPRQTLRLTFEEGIAMLQAAGCDVDPLGDLSTETERVLGRLVKEKYQTDFYILHRYPLNARPFYTMPCPDDGRYTNSFDVFIRGEEIISGAQRIHDADMLAKRAVECGLEVETIRDYIESFRFGAYPHGGFGVGLERVVMLFLGLDNIRKTSMFPRDPKRLTP